MPQFAFEGIDLHGRETHGVLDAADRAVALEALRGEGVTPLELRDGAAAPHRRIHIPSQSAREALPLLRDLAALLTAGLTLEEALPVAGRSGGKRRARLAKDLHATVRAGHAFSHALARWPALFPPLLCSAVAAAEAGGQLGPVLSKLAHGLARSAELRARLLSALLYPAFVVVAMLGVLAVVFAIVLPRLRPLFDDPDAVLPWTTHAVIALADAVEGYGDAAAITATLGLAGAAVLLRGRRAREAADRRALALPGIGRLFGAAEGAALARTLAMLLEGGVPLARALDHAVAGGRNRHWTARLAAAAARVREGASLRDAFTEAGVLPAVLLEMAAVGERSGRLAPLLADAAAILEQDLTRTLDRAAALIAPVATLVLGALTALLMAGVVGGLMAVNDLAGVR